jgi:hypothetical protein
LRGRKIDSLIIIGAIAQDVIKAMATNELVAGATHPFRFVTRSLVIEAQRLGQEGDREECGLVPFLLGVLLVAFQASPWDSLLPVTVLTEDNGTVHAAAPDAALALGAASVFIGATGATDVSEARITSKDLAACAESLRGIITVLTLLLLVFVREESKLGKGPLEVFL